MKVYQRDIVEIPFNLPQGIIHHPAIVLSVDKAIEDEESFIAVMLTTEKHNDEFAFEIFPDMLTKKLLKPYCEARLHLISFFSIRDIVPNSHWNNRIKEDDFLELIKQINRLTFGIDI